MVGCYTTEKTEDRCDVSIRIFRVELSALIAAVWDGVPIEYVAINFGVSELQKSTLRIIPLGEPELFLM